jgi:branched-chain amino acid transport system permease protein
MSALQFVEGSTAHRAYRWVTWGLFALVALLVPFWAVQTPSVSIGDSTFTFSLGNLSHAVAYMVGVLGLGLLVGYNGQISLGNSFFMGMGGYITAWLVTDHGWPYIATLVVVLPATFVIGMLVGLPALRIRGLYLALTTLGLAAVFPAIVRLEQLRDATGGANGKRVDADLEAPSWLPLDTIAEALAAIPLIGEWIFGEGRLGGRDERGVWVYLLVALLAAVAFWVTRNLIYSRPGRSIIAIRDNETGAAVSGVNLAKTKTLTFGASAALGGLSGTMYVMAIQFVAPDVFGINLAIFLIVGLVVGGVGTLSGAVIGGLTIIFVPLWASQISSVPAIPERFLRGPTGTFFLGVLLIVLTFFLPGGVVYGARQIRSKLIRVVPSPRPSTPSTDVTEDVHQGGAERIVDRHDDAISEPVSTPAQRTNQGEIP